MLSRYLAQHFDSTTLTRNWSRQNYALVLYPRLRHVSQLVLGYVRRRVLKYARSRILRHGRRHILGHVRQSV